MNWMQNLGRAEDVLEGQLPDDVNLEIVARTAAMSEDEFTRLFTRVTGLTIGEYIRARRMTHAAKLLQNGDAKVIDIAQEVGYDSAAAFSRAFGAFHGATPTEVRGGTAYQFQPAISFKSIIEEWYKKMSKFSDRGYIVRETGPVYNTLDMSRTAAWFRDVLGWYGDIIEKDEQGNGLYGCVYDVPDEIAAAHVAPFNGIHMFRGQPADGWVAFIQVTDIEALYSYVKRSGWEQVDPPVSEPWGSKTCEVVTIDGSVLRFFD